MDSNRGLNFQKELVDISNVILNRNSYPGELLKHTHVLFTELEKINSVESFRHATVDAVILESGKAIDPFSAAHCLIDYCRTTRFMRALYDAVLEAKTRFSKKPIHIFYAGTGPYASLMLPLTTRFSPDEIQFSMVEVHPITFEMLKSTLNTLGFEKYVKNYINQDA